MTVEERRVSNARGADQFPVGLRVLAVDDDSTCLKLLETLLRRCLYHVTSTNQAIVALKMLRENKDKFDLVISDVHMPDMDGFKLLELVVFEMGLPVIMLSGNSDPKVVMEGIAHGACDYLVKPVRMEELRNIWQHVFRRRKLHAKDRSNCHTRDDAEKIQNGNSDGGHGPALSGSSDRTSRLNRKRKDQKDEDDDEFDENVHDNEDSSTQKKPRVVWTVDLHRKFVAAVSQLGIDKAMPKRILDLMNDEKLTRENVASHLQKYRLYLKRISTVANQQANMVAALGGKDTQFLSMGSLDGMRNYHGFPGSGQLTTLASVQQGGMLGRLNSANNQALFGLGSAGMIQLGGAHSNVSNPIHDLGKFPQISFSGTHQVNLIPGVPIMLETNQLQQHKLLMESSGNLLNSSSNVKVPVCESNNPYLTATGNLPILQASLPQQSSGFSNPSAARLSKISTDIFDGSAGVSSNPPDISKCNETWAANGPIAGHTSNTLHHGPNEDLSSVIPPTENTRHNSSSNKSMVSSLNKLVIGRDMQCQVYDVNPNTTLLPSNENDTYGLLDIGASCSSIQRWDNLPEQTLEQSFQYSSSNPSFDIVHNCVGYSDGLPPRMVGFDELYRKLQIPNNKRPILNDIQRQKDGHGLEPAKLQGVFNTGDYNTFDELMSAIVKQERDDVLLDSDVNCDLFPLETCM